MNNSLVDQNVDLKVVALTRGALRGHAPRRDRRAKQSARHATKIVDTVGAGDAFTAALAIGLLENNLRDAFVQLGLS